MEGLPVELREKETVKFSRCSIDKFSLRVLLRINFEYIATLKYLIILCNLYIIILLRGRNSVLKCLLQKIRAPKK
jgi:hypothetical protein